MRCSAAWRLLIPAARRWETRVEHRKYRGVSAGSGNRGSCFTRLALLAGMLVCFVAGGFSQTTSPLNNPLNNNPLNNPLGWPSSGVPSSGSQTPSYPMGSISPMAPTYNPRGRSQQLPFGQQPYSTSDQPRGLYSPYVVQRPELPPDRITEFQQLVQISNGQLLPIFGA